LKGSALGPNAFKASFRLRDLLSRSCSTRQPPCSCSQAEYAVRIQIVTIDILFFVIVQRRQGFRCSGKEKYR